jgi:uncharacterized membrane protein
MPIWVSICIVTLLLTIFVTVTLMCKFKTASLSDIWDAIVPIVICVCVLSVIAFFVLPFLRRWVWVYPKCKQKLSLAKTPSQIFDGGVEAAGHGQIGQYCKTMYARDTFNVHEQDTLCEVRLMKRGVYCFVVYFVIPFGITLFELLCTFIAQQTVDPDGDVNVRWEEFANNLEKIGLNALLPLVQMWLVWVVCIDDNKHVELSLQYKSEQNLRARNKVCCDVRDAACNQMWTVLREQRTWSGRVLTAFEKIAHMEVDMHTTTQEFNKMQVEYYPYALVFIISLLFVLFAHAFYNERSIKKDPKSTPEERLAAHQTSQNSMKQILQFAVNVTAPGPSLSSVLVKTLWGYLSSASVQPTTLQSPQVMPGAPPPMPMPYQWQPHYVHQLHPPPWQAYPALPYPKLPVHSDGTGQDGTGQDSAGGGHQGARVGAGHDGHDIAGTGGQEKLVSVQPAPPPLVGQMTCTDCKNTFQKKGNYIRCEKCRKRKAELEADRKVKRGKP